MRRIERIGNLGEELDRAFEVQPIPFQRGTERLP